MAKVSRDLTDAVKVVSQYFDGLYNGDTELLGKVFHPSAQLATVGDQGLVTLDIPAWLKVIANRESSASRKEARLDRIVSIEFGSTTTAIARVNCAIGPKLFTDFLSLVRLADGWKIIAKVYQFEMIA